MAGGSRNKPKRRPPAKRPRTARAPARPTASAAGAPGAGAGAPPRKTQAQRLEEARRARARKSRTTRLVLAGAVAVLIGLVVFISVSKRRDAAALEERLEAAGCRFDTRSDPTDRANPHVPPAGYEVDPPAGGNHAVEAAPAGTYTTENRPTDAQIVHSLEHGYIAIWRRPGADEAVSTAVTEAVEGYERDVLVVPRESLPVPVAATAWGERLLCSTPVAASLREFVEAYRNKGPERIEHPPI